MNERKEERKEGMRKVQRKYVKREGMEARLAEDRKRREDKGRHESMYVGGREGEGERERMNPFSLEWNGMFILARCK